MEHWRETTYESRKLVFGIALGVNSELEKLVLYLCSGGRV